MNISDQIWLVVIGALIGQIPALILLLVKDRLDNKKEAEKREYEEYLAEKQRARDKRAERLHELDVYIHDLIEIINETRDASVTCGVTEKDWVDLFERRTLLTGKGHIISIIYEYGDEELGKYFTQVFRQMSEIQDQISQKRAGKDVTLRQLMDTKDLYTLYGKIIRKLDDLSIE